jgi:DNA repair protein RadC
LLNRERYLLNGPTPLSDAELVALVLETGVGGRTPLQIAVELLERGGGIRGLAKMQPHEWVSVDGIGPARAVRVHAAIELGRRFACGEPVHGSPVNGPKQAFAVLGPPLFDLAEEELHALYLDRRHRPLAHRRLTRGSDALTVVEPRQVFRLGLGVGAASVILAHNHPSGDPTPSAEDRAVNERVARVGQVVGVTVLDHLVVGGREFVSLGNPFFGAPPQVSWTE